MDHGHTRHSALGASQKGHWRIAEVIGGENRLGSARAFMPEALARRTIEAVSPAFCQAPVASTRNLQH